MCQCKCFYLIICQTNPGHDTHWKTSRSAHIEDDFPSKWIPFNNKFLEWRVKGEHPTWETMSSASAINILDEINKLK